jgi:tetratricopeptide (TPR) repeat protein
MTQIRAFVGHSFTTEDDAVVASFLTYFDQMKGALPDFDWVHARAAEPKELATKVLKLVEDRNVFIGICTRKERVVGDQKLRAPWMRPHQRVVDESDLVWKTSDWIIQEIGLAIGRDMTIVLLLENGCRKPGGLQGDVEFIPFERRSPERAFGRLLEMMKALSPRSGAGEITSPDVGTESGQPDRETPPAPDDDTPDDSWAREQFENALFWKLIKRDDGGAKRVDAAFSASKHAADPAMLATWRARTELWRIRFGEHGSLSRLLEHSQQFPVNREIATDVASGLAALGMHSEAGRQYLEAAELAADDRAESERLRGLAAVQLAKAGETSSAEDLLMQQRRSLESGTKNEQLNYLFRLREISSEQDDQSGEIEALERIVKLTPDDWDSRFNLAYKYSEQKMNEMALFHYLQIPRSERSSVAWNNLGVSFQQLSMPAKSINAYRTASSKGETLAMANLAYKLMQSGFLNEADDELQRALKIEDFHRNVGEAVSALKDIPDEEDKTLREVLKRIEPTRQFFQKLAEAITLPDPKDLPVLWIGPDCELAISVKAGELTAAGEYDRPPNALASAFTSGLKTTRYKLTYTGKMRGRRVRGTLTRKSDSAKQSAGLLALGADEDIEFAMVIHSDGTTISVVERQSSSTPRFYDLRAK